MVEPQHQGVTADECFLPVCGDVPRDVVLTDPGTRTLDLAHVVRRLTGLSLRRSELPAVRPSAVILADVPREDAETAATAPAMRKHRPR